MREAIRKRADSCSSSFRYVFLGLMHLVRKTYRDAKDIKTFEVPEELFNRTFIRHVMNGAREASRRNERVYDLHENHAEYRFNGTRYRVDMRIYEYRAIEYLPNLKNRMIVNLKRFMIRSIFTLYPGLFRK